MGCVIDHLQVDHHVRVVRGFADSRDMRHEAGESGIIRHMDLDWGRQEIVIEWEREGIREKMAFLLDAKSGPRNGHMREFFVMEERVPLPEDTIAGRARLNRPVVPAPAAEPVADAALYTEAVARVWALGARGRFAEAEDQIRLILAQPDPHGGRLQQLAEELVEISAAHASDADGAVFDWFRERAIVLWYAWGSGATSGGEGTARAQYIRAAERRLAACARLRI
jgi:hypothetical protein